ncbi:MAG: hypothetical protein U0975_04595 [Erythrobacter sp.]|nr:hypothetical protein [Erythrobacter sp.]MDZ4271931.1 hypothetical protein [Erythrobacter sp.]
MRIATVDVSLQEAALQAILANLAEAMLAERLAGSPVQPLIAAR